MSAVWEIPPRNTDDDAYRAEIDRRREENHRRWNLQQAAVDAKYRKPKPRPTTTPKPRNGTAEPCPTCGRLTRPCGTRAENYPDTIKRAKSGHCYRCNVRPESTGPRVCKYDKCDNLVPAGSYGHREYCSDICRRRASNPIPKTRVTCKQCGVKFTRAPNQRREYCTDECYSARRRDQKKRGTQQWREKQTPRPPDVLDCAHCGEPFTRSPRASQIYCKPRCRWAAQRAKARATRQEEAA